MTVAKAQIVHEKLVAAVKLLRVHNVDTWLILTRESNDPSLPFVTDIRTYDITAIFINKSGSHQAIVSKEDYETFKLTEVFSDVITYDTHIEEAFLKVFHMLAPKKLALNISHYDHLYDGLSLGLYKWLERLIGSNKLGEMEVTSEPILQQLRCIKSAVEIEMVKKSINHTTDIFEEAFAKMEAGMTEKEIGQLFVDGMKKRGVTNGLGDPYDLPLVCIVRCGLAHRKPGDHKVEPGDIVIIDFSLRCEGYVSDIARTCYFLKEGEAGPPEDVQKAFDAAVDGITKSIEALQPGKLGYEIDAVGRVCIEGHGYPTVRHSVGHQVGRATHDGGTILGPRRTPPRPQVEGLIQSGEIYAIEPTVIQDHGLPCILVEENVLVTDEGPDILSERQLELITIPYKGVK
ncbi:M24 family metallopeptidase [Pseudalkalibacillus salsuginis]|uniref:M24 family metallopeptidase n=1 Tax=Pseudalkalibacillus salsuginis TaxID=2910972 RepID=UPI001F3767D2|nr:M24 family metallopeptidase [Pseudalkalibacillus salsuginis]MCF6408930.1 M24 family metallopeptidase [Pseudalkalibacillus salsuginis]